MEELYGFDRDSARDLKKYSRYSSYYQNNNSSTDCNVEGSCEPMDTWLIIVICIVAGVFGVIFVTYKCVRKYNSRRRLANPETQIIADMNKNYALK